MIIIKSIVSLSKIIAGVKPDKRIGYVPTMGALHLGHISLIRAARRENDMVVVSIFVNPLQFGPKEDFTGYPRGLRKDAWLCERFGADIIFCPNYKVMYPEGFSTLVQVAGLSEVLCGASRPGHFQGVATVVAKLFNIVQPDTAYFGQKDAQQVAVIKKMAGDLNMPVKIKVVPTARDTDGLALSSRNRYLNAQERKDASVLYKSLSLARRLISKGQTSSPAIIAAMKRLISTVRSAKIDYVAIVDVVSFKPKLKISDKVLIMVAVWIGKTRLIDNMEMQSN